VRFAHLIFPKQRLKLSKDGISLVFRSEPIVHATEAQWLPTVLEVLNALPWDQRLL
jgi:hypothetical protein